MPFPRSQRFTFRQYSCLFVFICGFLCAFASLRYFFADKNFSEGWTVYVPPPLLFFRHENENTDSLFRERACRGSPAPDASAEWPFVACHFRAHTREPCKKVTKGDKKGHGPVLATFGSNSLFSKTLPNLAKPCQTLPNPTPGFAPEFAAL
jgi:hypothetical protein